MHGSSFPVYGNGISQPILDYPVDDTSASCFWGEFRPNYIVIFLYTLVNVTRTQIAKPDEGHILDREMDVKGVCLTM